MKEKDTNRMRKKEEKRRRRREYFGTIARAINCANRNVIKRTQEMAKNK